MLYVLYQFTRDWDRFHELCRNILIRCELPVLTFLLKGIGSSQVIARHSIRSPGFFNVFMSDIDLSVEAPEQKFHQIHAAALLIRRILPNLGEIEFYTHEEWDELRELTHSPLDATWERLHLLRKLSWQKKARHLARTSYEKAKQDRGISSTLKRLGLTAEENFMLDELFPEIAIHKDSGTSPGHSHYLEQELRFKDKASAAYFWKHLPDSAEHPQDKKAKELKSHLVRREILLTKVSQRSESLHGKTSHLKTKDEWINRLNTIRQELGK